MLKISKNFIHVKSNEIYVISENLIFFKLIKLKINRKFRVPRKQRAHFLGIGAQIQDYWVFSSSV
jgi:hypothetical protein